MFEIEVDSKQFLTICILERRQTFYFRQKQKKINSNNSNLNKKFKQLKNEKTLIILQFFFKLAWCSFDESG